MATHEIIRNDLGTPVSEMFENENVIIVNHFMVDECEVTLKPTCSKKVREVWEKLNQPIRK